MLKFHRGTRHINNNKLKYISENEKPNVTDLYRTELLEKDAPLIVQLPKDDNLLLHQWSPWKRQRILNDEEEEKECEEQSSIDEFPDDLFTRKK